MLKTLEQLYTSIYSKQIIKKEKDLFHYLYILHSSRTLRFLKHTFQGR